MCVSILGNFKQLLFASNHAGSGEDSQLRVSDTSVGLCTLTALLGSSRIGYGMLQ